MNDTKRIDRIPGSDSENRFDHWPQIKAGDFVSVEYGMRYSTKNFKGTVVTKLNGSLQILRADTLNDFVTVLPQPGLKVKTTESDSGQSSTPVL